MFLASILECLQPRIEALGLRFLAHYIDEHDDEAAAARTIYAEKKVRGLVFLGGSVAGRESALKLPAIPCIYATLDARTVRMENVFSVSIDDRAASFAATEYLLARGHRNIAVLGGKLDAENPIALRYRGVVDAFSARGFAFPVKNYISAGFSLSSAFAAMDAELRNGFHRRICDVGCYGHWRDARTRGSWPHRSGRCFAHRFRRHCARALYDPAAHYHAPKRGGYRATERNPSCARPFRRARPAPCYAAGGAHCRRIRAPHCS